MYVAINNENFTSTYLLTVTNWIGRTFQTQEARKLLCLGADSRCLIMKVLTLSRNCGHCAADNVGAASFLGLREEGSLDSANNFVHESCGLTPGGGLYKALHHRKSALESAVRTFPN